MINIKYLALGLMFGGIGLAHGASPLLMEGKTTLFQRVLTTPSCVLKTEAKPEGTKVPAFTRYYVYSDDGQTLQVGANSEGDILGAIDKKCTVEWKQQMALMFTNPAGRDRAIIFDTKQKLEEIINSDRPEQIVRPIIMELDKGRKLDYVVAREPAKYVDFKKQFYLLPILESSENIFADNNTVRELKIASVNAKDQDTGAKDSKDSKAGQQPKDRKSEEAKDQGDITSFKAAVVFVIDASISMQPYIDRTKAAISAIIEKIGEEQGPSSSLIDSVHFGLVAFRSNTKAVPGLQYESKMFVNPGQATTVEAFNKKLAGLRQATVSSKLFDEDAYSGISRALSEVNWKRYGGRYLVLITDAGAIEGTNPLTSTGLDSKELRLEAEHHGAAIYALHLLTDIGADNHEKAKAQYQDLTFNNIVQKPLYYSVYAGDVDAFGKLVDELATAITQQVKMASEGKLSAGSAVATEGEGGEMERDIMLLGYAMQLAYLGSKQNVAASDFLEGWIADRDLIKTTQPTATPVVLLNKAQLSDLNDLVKKIIEAANQGVISPDAMFEQLKAIALNMGKDPDQLKDSSNLKIANFDLLGEYLDDLPYKSEIANIDESYWQTMSAQEQDNLIKSLESKINYYQIYNDDTSRWVRLAEDADENEAVYPVPLEALP